MMLRELGLVIEKIDNKELIGRVLEILWFLVKFVIFGLVFMWFIVMIMVVWL